MRAPLGKQEWPYCLAYHWETEKSQKFNAWLFTPYFGLTFALSFCASQIFLLELMLSGSLRRNILAKPPTSYNLHYLCRSFRRNRTSRLTVNSKQFVPSDRYFEYSISTWLLTWFHNSHVLQLRWIESRKESFSKPLHAIHIYCCQASACAFFPMRLHSLLVAEGSLPSDR